MKTDISQPDYGPVRLELHLEVEPSLKECLDDALHLFFFLPAETIVHGFSRILHVLEEKERKLLGIPMGKSTTQSTPG